MPRHPPARGESREAQEVTGTLSARTGGGGSLGTDFDLDGGIVSHTLSRNGGYDAETETFIAQTVTADMYRSGGGSSRSLVAIDPNQITSAGNRSNPQVGDPCHTLPSAGNSPLIAGATRLRRLTAMECERLQGFPDHWTAIDSRRRKISAAMAQYLLRHGLEAVCEDGRWFTRIAADAPRYRAIGNSMAVPVVRYLLERIRAVDAITVAREPESKDK